MGKTLLTLKIQEAHDEPLSTRSSQRSPNSGLALVSSLLVEPRPKAGPEQMGQRRVRRPREVDRDTTRWRWERCIWRRRRRRSLFSRKPFFDDKIPNERSPAEQIGTNLFSTWSSNASLSSLSSKSCKQRTFCFRIWSKISRSAT